MIYLQVFLHSIRLPRKDAMFQLNRIGMDAAVIYMFILLAIVSVPELIERLSATTGFGADLNFILKLIYFFMFYYLPLTIIVIMCLSLIAYAGRGLTYLMRRKLRYPVLWKMCAFTTTIPFLFYAVITFIFQVSDIYLVFAFIYTTGLLVRMILHYPKRRERT
ncbi:hypothetical protein [Oceanobacillus damuensis]|uniref:hypothetical protein n=1 Tax=Oceanobacillus damuensis TaxID=937928 RepID=UPI00082EB78A|nr:hypothetical protein [Oceanobacillus damuensis]